MEEIKSGVYKLFKGKFSKVICTAKHSDRDEILVIYQGLNDGGHFARPLESFTEIVKDANGNDVPRFSLATEEDLESLKKQGLI